MKKVIFLIMAVLTSMNVSAQKGKFITNYDAKGQDEIHTSTGISFVRDGQADRYAWRPTEFQQADYSSLGELFDIKNVKSIFRHVESDNQFTIEIPSNAPVSQKDVIVQAYGEEIAPTENNVYSTGANSVSVLNKNGKTIYECYASGDTLNGKRTIELNALETAYTLLLPLFPFVFEPTSDEILLNLKSLLAELSETQALAKAIDKSVVKNGYLEIDDVVTEYQAAMNRIIEILGLRNNYLKSSEESARMGGARKMPASVIDGNKVYGLKLEMNGSEWHEDDLKKWWKCNFTAYNSNRFAYTGWTEGYKDANGYAHVYPYDISMLNKRILKPQNVSTFIKKTTSWEGIKDFLADSYSLFFDEGFGFDDMTWDNTKKSFDLTFYTPNDIVVVLGPADDDLMLYYNFMKAILEAPAKKISKKILSAEDDDYMLNFCIDLLADEDFRRQFTEIYNGSNSMGKKALEVFKLAWPKFEKHLKEEIEDDTKFMGILYVWTRYGIKDALQLDNAFDEIEDNFENKWLKMVEFWGDLTLGILGLTEGNQYYNLSLDFTDPLPVSKESFTVNGVRFNMVYVKGGDFKMGALDNDKDASSEEKPLHDVKLSDFAIGEKEVTQALWNAVMGSNPSKFKGTELPVENVSWNDCQEFIKQLNEITGKNFRLPTEAEWEYAARGGQSSRGYKYAGSNDIDAVAWYEVNGKKTTHPVGWKNANELGIYDMSGNVMEWCQDYYDGGYYGKNTNWYVTDPCNDIPGFFTNRVLRGGCWHWSDKYCRITSRSNNGPGIKSEIFGLRLALSEEATSPGEGGGVIIDVPGEDL